MFLFLYVVVSQIIHETNVPKISEAARAAMETDLTLEELSSSIKSKAMKDT